MRHRRIWFGAALLLVAAVALRYAGPDRAVEAPRPRPDAAVGTPFLPPTEPAAPDGAVVPPDVLAFAAGRRPAPRVAEAALGELDVSLGPPATGSPAPAARVTAGADAAADAATERERRARWVGRNQRRNRLRVEVLASELGLGAGPAGELAAVFEGTLADRVKLYESLDPGAPDGAALAEGLRRIREAEASRLQAVLGAAGYQTHLRLEGEGRFVLPEEMKRPPR